MSNTLICNRCAVRLASMRHRTRMLIVRHPVDDTGTFDVHACAPGEDPGEDNFVCAMFDWPDACTCGCAVGEELEQGDKA